MSNRDNKANKSVAVRVADRDEVLELNFVPQWARKGAGAGIDLSRYDDGGDGRGSAAGRSHDRRPRRDRDASRGGDRRPRRPGGGSGDRDARGGDRRDPGRRAEGRGRSDSVSHPVGDVPRGAPRERQFREEAPLPPVSVRFLPEQKHLSALVKQVTSAHRAYPLMDLAHLLLEKEGCCFVKVTPSKDAPDDFVFHTCKRCGYAALTEPEVRNHISSAHFEDIFETEEVEVEPPSGNFVCVAKCGMSGEYLGPPNHHSYNERIREVHAARYATMPMDAYRERIVLLHEEEEVEAWRKACSVQRRYRLRTAEKVDPEAEAEGADALLNWVSAQAHMRDHVVPGGVSVARKAVMNEAVARTVSDAGLRRAIREEWRSEMRFPVHIAFALRAAFRHRHLYTFKAGSGKGVNFVTGIQPSPISPEHTIDMIRQVLTLLHDSPGIGRANVLEAVVPGVGKDAPEAREVLQAIHWLIEKGHIIEFYNGALSVPLGKHAAGKAAPHLPGFKQAGRAGA